MGDPQLDSLIRQVSNWDRWGPDDERGTVNLITPQRRRHAASLVRKGAVFSLAISFDLDGVPQLPVSRRINPQHWMLQTGTDLRAGCQAGAVDGWGYADDIFAMATHAATHWDGLSHIFYDYQMWGGRDCTLVGAGGAARNGIEKLSGEVVGRGVLLDFPRLLGVDWLEMDHRISVAEIEGAFEAGRVEPMAGDILLLRTGNMRRARRNGGWEDYVGTDEPGFGIEVLPWLHEHDIAGVAIDNWGFEALPAGHPSIWLPVHAVAVVHMGLLLGENFSLEELAEDCAADGVYEFLFTGLPLPLTGAVAGPVHPAAVK
jgi:kynurenine formamidase